ncbi:MAG: hypothetical protein J7L61_01545, partial [Thermoplasmata archaeon]|nr:hypothetical protein [Thermoplasmata archaeon]
GIGGVGVPRRKYGRLRKAISPPPREKCRACRLGYPCPVHSREGDGGSRPTKEEIRRAKRVEKGRRKKRKG